MELLDYIKLRWKPLLVLLVVGVVVILVAGSRTGGSGYQAQTVLLVRPSSDEVPAYASDPDRYVTTQMRLLYTPANLKREVGPTSVSVATLARNLTYMHSSGSDFVTLTVSDPDPKVAVLLADSVAEAYLNEAEEQAGASDSSESSTIQDLIDHHTEPVGQRQQHDRPDDAGLHRSPNPDKDSAPRVIRSLRVPPPGSLCSPTRLQGFYGQLFPTCRSIKHP